MYETEINIFLNLLIQFSVHSSGTLTELATYPCSSKVHSSKSAAPATCKNKIMCLKELTWSTNQYVYWLFLASWVWITYTLMLAFMFSCVLTFYLLTNNNSINPPVVQLKKSAYCMTNLIFKQCSKRQTDMLILDVCCFCSQTLYKHLQTRPRWYWYFVWICSPFKHILNFWILTPSIDTSCCSQNMTRLSF